MSSGQPVADHPSLEGIARFETQIRTLYQSLRSEFIRELAAKKLSYSSMLVLFIVNRSGSATMGEIQRELGLAHSTVTGLVDTLYGRGLVEREQDPADRRVILVRPTALGKEEVATLRAKRVKDLASAWPADVSSRDLEECILLLERLNRSLGAAAERTGVAAE